MNDALIEKARRARDLGHWFWIDTKAYQDNPHPLHIQDMHDHLNALEQMVREAKAALAQVKQEVSA